MIQGGFDSDQHHPEGVMEQRPGVWMREKLPGNLLSPPDIYRMDISYLQVISSLLQDSSAIFELPLQIILHTMKNQG